MLARLVQRQPAFFQSASSRSVQHGLLHLIMHRHVVETGFAIYPFRVLRFLPAMIGL